MQSPHTATCRASGGSESAENAGSGARALGSWRSRRAVLRQEKASGIWGRPGEERQADPRTRQELGKQRGRERREPGRALCWERSGLLETRRIRFQINEIWVHTFTLLLPALMLF